MKAETVPFEVFKWQDLQFSQVDEDTYMVSSTCVVLVDGRDPRDLPLSVLKEAFQVEDGDHAEYSWEAPILDRPLERGDSLKLTVVVTLAPIQDDVKKKACRTLTVVTHALADIETSFTAAIGEEDVQEDVVKYISLNGMLNAMKAQIGLIQSVLRS